MFCITNVVFNGPSSSYISFAMTGMSFFPVRPSFKINTVKRRLKNPKPSLPTPKRPLSSRYRFHFAYTIMLQTLQTVYTVKNAVDDIGTSPQNEDGTIRGEETDEFHNKLHPGLMDIVGIAGCT
jgi:hypothetical protein